MREIKMKLVPYEMFKEDLENVFSEIKKGSIVIVDAKLQPEEEARIIEETMNRVDLKFKGIEISTLELSSNKENKLASIIKDKIYKLISGKERGITLIGSANIIKKIERNPEELSFYI
jgi:hypothetical protein